MKKKFVYLILFVSILIFLASLFSLHLEKQVVESESFYTSVNVTDDAIGFDLEGEDLTFGKVPRGGNVERGIIFDNVHPFPVGVRVEAEGDISDILFFDKSFSLEAEEERRISFLLYVSPDTETGFYDGEVKFSIRPA